MNCPNCGQNDAVQNAASAGLASPAEPSSTPSTLARLFQVLGGCWFLIPVGAFIIGVVIFGLMLLFDMAIMSQDPVSGGIGAVMTGVSFVPMVICLVPILFVMGLAGIGIPMLARRHVAKTHEAGMERWRRSTERFNALFYCSRCAGVFLEGQNRVVPLEHLATFLNEQPPA